MKPHDLAISVTPRWNDWHLAHARLGDLGDVHWHQPQGAPHAIIHAYVSCTDLVSGDPSHSCYTASAPHRLLVCVLKKHNVPSAYAELARQADEGRGSSVHRSPGFAFAASAPMPVR